MIERHTDADCPIGIVDHIAEIEAGWTLKKWWKVDDEDKAVAENRQEVRDMLDRWKAHGIVVSER